MDMIRVGGIIRLRLENIDFTGKSNFIDIGLLQNVADEFGNLFSFD
jgi:hypothetical protein